MFASSVRSFYTVIRWPSDEKKRKTERENEFQIQYTQKVYNITKQNRKKKQKQNLNAKGMLNIFGFFFLVEFSS